MQMALDLNYFLSILIAFYRWFPRYGVSPNIQKAEVHPCQKYSEAPTPLIKSLIAWGLSCTPKAPHLMCVPPALGPVFHSIITGVGDGGIFSTYGYMGCPSIFGMRWVCYRYRSILMLPNFTILHLIFIAFTVFVTCAFQNFILYGLKLNKLFNCLTQL